MKIKSLINTNPYLKDKNSRQHLVARSVRTSCGVEGIVQHLDSFPDFQIPSRGKKKIYINQSK